LLECGKHAILSQFILLIAHYREISNYCSSSRIPANIVKPNELKTDLINVERELAKLNSQLAISTANILEYYKIPIATCQLTSDEIASVIKILIIHKNTNYVLYEAIPILFFFKGEICQLRTQKSLVLHERVKDEIRIPTGEAMEGCDGIKKMCAISHIPSKTKIRCV
jgi:hypothetical protein